MTNEKKQNYSIIEKEMFEALSICKEQFKLMVQIITILITANITVIGYVITSKNINLLYIGAILPLLILITRMVSNSLMVPIMYTAFYLEQKLDIKNTDLLSSTFIEMSYGKTFIKLKQICYLENRYDRISELKKLSDWKYTIFVKSNIPVTLFCIIASFFQLLSPPFTWELIRTLSM